MSVKVIYYTPKPLELIGTVASECWSSNPSPRIAKHCYKAGHLRTFEYADVILKLSGYSARVIRELYTHIIGTSKLQASTRYINYEDFGYFTPPKIGGNEEAQAVYDDFMSQVSETYGKLTELGIPKEDVANILPLDHNTTTVIKINARALFHLAELRLCSRAYHEFRRLVLDIRLELSKVGMIEDGEGWEYIASKMVPKCVNSGYCNEAYSCGLKPKKSDIEIVAK